MRGRRISLRFFFFSGAVGLGFRCWPALVDGMLLQNVNDEGGREDSG